MISEEAMRLAKAHAARDRDELARLVRVGRVRRDPAMGANVPGRAAFVADIEARVRPPVNTAIRPKKRRR